MLRTGTRCAYVAALLVLAWLPAEAGKRRNGKIVKVEHQRSEMVKVPGGKFLMGPNKKERAHLVSSCKRQLGVAAMYCTLQQPALTAGGLVGTVSVVRRHGLGGRGALTSAQSRSVYVSAFEIDRFEVTVAQYRKCVASGRCSLTPLVTGDRRYLRAVLPIVNVTWQDAVDYCSWQAKRLPTEAEWEKAARGTRGWRWPWGNHDRKDGHNHGKRSSNAGMVTRGIGSRLPGNVYPAFIPDKSDGARLAVAPGFMRWSESPYGAYDMAGNVSEWTADWFSKLGYRGLSTFNPIRSKADPGQALRAVRGGSWAEAKYMGRTYMRGFAGPSSRSATRGFRCARDAVQ